MTRHQPASNTTLLTTTDTQASDTHATDTQPASRLAVDIQQYVDEIVAREVTTAQAKLAAHSTLTDEEAAVLYEMANRIAADMVAERVRRATNGDYDGGHPDTPDKQCERIAALFGLSPAAATNGTRSESVDP